MYDLITMAHIIIHINFIKYVGFTFYCLIVPKVLNSYIRPKCIPTHFYALPYQRHRMFNMPALM